MYSRMLQRDVCFQLFTVQFAQCMYASISVYTQLCIYMYVYVSEWKEYI